MNRRLLSGALVLGATLATVGAAVSADGDSRSLIGAVDVGVMMSAPIDQVPDSDRAQVQVPIRNGRLVDDPVEQATQPIMVRIGDIGLEAPILSVGVDEQNQLDVPSADAVGWYEHSALPGEPGAAVLAAHVDYAGRPGAFFDLADLRPGDPLEVELSDGTLLRYRVEGNTEYQKTELPAEEVFRKSGDTVLQLITCGGEFDPAARSYLANVVITAVPVTPPSF